MSAIEDFLAQLEMYRVQAQAQQDANTEQASYWHGVRFGLELALMEAQNRLTPPKVSVDPPAAFYADIDQLVSDYFERIVTLCQASIKRDLLVFNIETIRTELQQAIQKQAKSSNR